MISLIHHWMEFFRGGESVLEQFCILFPNSPISVLTYQDKALSATMRRHVYRTSWIHRFPKLRIHFRKLLPLFPELIRSVSVAKETRFVLSSDASMIKGARIPEDAVHVCYCHSPPRYIWGQEDTYLDSSAVNGRPARWIFGRALPRLRRFDRAASARVDHFIANSRCVQERIRRYYGRESVVIHPPVHVERFDSSRLREDFYLIVSALVPYKRVDLAVAACSQLGRPLVVIGAGPEEAVLRRRAAPSVKFLGWKSTEAVRDHFERCRAFIFPGIEDFGITPCEAQAAGAPVIAFGEGGALETVRAGISGLFFREQTVDSLVDAIIRCEATGFSATACRANVAHLGPDRFRSEVRAFLERQVPEVFADFAWPGDAEDSDPVMTATTLQPVHEILGRSTHSVIARPSESSKTSV